MMLYFGFCVLINSCSRIRASDSVGTVSQSTRATNVRITCLCNSSFDMSKYWCRRLDRFLALPTYSRLFSASYILYTPGAWGAFSIKSEN